MERSARIGWIDEFKGFVLLLVCLFHIEQSFSNAPMGMLHLSALRMSAFFFISGMLFSTRRFGNFRDYFVHKTKVLLFPYISLSLLFLLLDPVLYNFDLFAKAPRMSVMNVYPEIRNVGDYIFWNLAKIFVAGKSSIGSGPLWFVFTLYSVSLLFYLVQKVLSKVPMAWEKILVAGVAVLSLASGWVMYRNHVRLPLGLERDLTVLFFFACGWLSKDAVKALSAKETVSRWFLPVAVTMFVLYALVERPDPYFSIMNNDLGKSFAVFFLSSVFGIVGLVSTFLWVERFPNTGAVGFIKGVLRNISRNALVILAVHWWILLVMRLTFRAEINKPGLAYLLFFVVVLGTSLAIPLFRCWLYWLLGKKQATFRECFSLSE